MTKPRTSVLVVDDEPFNVDLLAQDLELSEFRVLTAEDGRRALALAAEEHPDAILLDVMMPGIDGFETCRRLKADPRTREIPVIFMTALSDVRDKLSAFEAGGADYVTKPFQIEEVLARIEVHVANRRLQAELRARNARLQQEIADHQRARATVQMLRDEIDQDRNTRDIVGDSPPMRALLERLERVAGTDATVLILGETGTGKELVARAVHLRSHRARQPLVKVNCAALPRDLIESEMFGHEKGAFTGATQQRKGRFELADGGTIFLDEVGELTLEAQAKLLRVLQEQEIERVGGARTIRVDVRVIAATNRDLGAAAQSGEFRSDLYYRLNVFPVSVPPLRERRDDIVRLAEHFLARSARRLGRRLDAFSPAARAALLHYPWPGNVRELENVVERAAILSPGPVVELDEPLDAHHAGGPASGGAGGAGGETLEDVERSHILRVLERTGGTIEGPTGAAAILGLNPSTLRGRLRKLGIR